jgi:hypothetical protein
VWLKITNVKLIKVLRHPDKFMGLTKAELNLYMRDRRQLIERVQREFPEMEIDDTGKSRKSPQTKVRFFDRLSTALSDKRITIPYGYTLENMQFSYSNEDDDPEEAAIVEAKNATPSAKAAFLEAAKSVLGSVDNIRIKSVAFDELDEEDATYKILVTASDSDHSQMLSKICGTSEDEIKEMLTKAAARPATKQVPKSVVDDFVAYVMEEQYKLFMESFQSNPESFDNEEPQKMARTEAIDFINRSLGEGNDDVLDRLKDFAKSSGYSPDDVLEAIMAKYKRRI